jgi:dolichol-phosphate mannosyltransferase
VDDGSKDNTFQLLSDKISVLSHAEIVRHEKNKNLGGALKTGVSTVKGTDYVAFLDSDCTYTPEIIFPLLDALDEGADLATVSPYHPRGLVEGVPAWRLVLSKGVSFIYRILLSTPFFTYTAMVRAVRTEKIPHLLNERNDFSFVALFFIKAVRRRLRIVEIPATLSVRKFGVSKMNLIRTIKSHIEIIRMIQKGLL